MIGTSTCNYNIERLAPSGGVAYMSKSVDCTLSAYVDMLLAQGAACQAQVLMQHCKLAIVASVRPLIRPSAGG